MKNNYLFWILGAAAAGAAAMYYFDPDNGARRRSLVRDNAVGLSNDAGQSISETTEDLSNRAYGLIAESQKSVTGKPFDEIPASGKQP